MNEFEVIETGEIKTRNELIAGYKGMLPKVWKAATFEALGVRPVLAAPKPAPSSPLVIVRRAGVTDDGNGNRVQAWEEVPRHQDDEEGTKADKDTAYLIKIQEDAFKERVASFKREIQSSLDSFAQSHPEFNFADMERACGYADDPDAEYAAVGNYCKGKRSATWVAARSILRSVVAGQRAMPDSLETIENELPTLEWP